MLKAKKIKEYAKRCGADLVGIASMDRFEGAPKQADPRYIMPEAKAMIVMGFRIFRGTLRGIEEGTLFSNYSSMGYGGITYVQIPGVLWNFCKVIEDEGYEAIPIGHVSASAWCGVNKHAGLSLNERSRPVSPDKPAPDVFIHLRIAAFCAGLGEIGYSKVFLTPEFGPRQRFGVVLTDMPLEADPLYEGPKLCDRCMQCVTNCPGGAISETETVKIKIAGREIEWGKLDEDKCALGLRGGENITKPDEKGEYLEGRTDIKPGPFSPFYHKPGNLFRTGEAIGGGRGCVRACMIHLEKQGKLKNKFKQEFRRRKPWRIDW